MSAANPTQFIEHIVLLKIKQDVDPSKVTAMFNEVNSLASLDMVLHFTAGPLLSCRRSISPAFTHMQHSRYASKADLDNFCADPTHLAIFKEIKPLLQDFMVVDWVYPASSVTIPSGSVMRVMLWKSKEKLEEEEKNEVLRVVEGIKEKFPGIQQLSFGENISPDWAKGFSIASIAVFEGRNELEEFDSGWEAAAMDALVLDYVIP